MKNRLHVEDIAVVLPIIVEQYPFYAPMTFALYTLDLRYCHVAAMWWVKLSPDGVIAIEESYDVSDNVFSPVDQRKKAPPAIALAVRLSGGWPDLGRLSEIRAEPGQRGGPPTER
jgi:hypothetical protein